ncbi:MAG: hypothetical protein R6V77_01160 [Candidatus Cloacimonadaceae bacterium]
MKKTLVMIAVFLAVTAMALEAKTGKAAKLENNLRQWEQFRWQGIVQVESSAFSMRKNFVLAKNEEALRMDILDSGVLGLQAKPLVTIYMKDRIDLEAPTIKQLSGLDLNWFLPPEALKGMINFTDSLRARSQEIIANRKLELASSLFTFDKNYRLSKIISDTGGLELTVSYNRRNQPTKVIIKRRDSKLAELQINEQKYGDIAIQPLITETEKLAEAENPEDIIPLEGKLFVLDLKNLEQMDMKSLLDSLKLSDKKLKDFNVDSLKIYLKDFEQTELPAWLDSLKLDLKGLEQYDFKQLLDKLNLDDLKLEELVLDSLKLDLKGLEQLDLQELLKKYNLDDKTLEDLMKEFKLEDMKLEELMQGIDWSELNLEELLRQQP